MTAGSTGKSRGAFVVFEGGDRTGKSTQVAKLIERLKGEGTPVEHFRFPRRDTPIGRLIGQYLAGEWSAGGCPQVANLLFTANRWEEQARLEKHLTEGTIVVCDRYSYSGIAYAVGALSLDAKWVKEAERGLIAPDCVFYLELDPTKAATRADYGNEIYEKHDVQQKVYEAFKVFSGESYWKPINAGRDIETVHSDIWESFQNVKNNLCDAPEAKIPRLWGDNL
eukprot:GHVT01047748.1.p1 GENE.GHVT01047748.1~~GHVT01047748.1.p1  ORF type:complete len:224 (-),score=2.85 GHVT01047748.1:2063-2734(-)